MGFINEVVSDEDIDRYALPFPKGAGRWWTRDRERDLYLWGGLSGNPAFDEPILGVFHLYVAGKSFEVVLKPGVGSINYLDKPYLIAWDYICLLRPEPLSELSKEELISFLKQGLEAFGEDGMANEFAPFRKVVFGF